MSGRRWAWTAAIGMCLMLGGSAQALAAQRYASPSGSGSTCSQQSPCAIQVAANNAGMGDEVIVAPGDYFPPTSVFTPVANVSIHGAQGQPMPRIHFTTGFLLISNPGDRASRLEVFGTNVSPVESNGGGEIDQIVAHSSGSGTAACLDFSTLIDSVCMASGADAPALEAQTNISITISARNLTLEASGSGGIGARFATASGNVTANLTNVIAHGPGSDITLDRTGGSLHANVDHSNHVSIAANGGATVTETNQQLAAPVFVNPAAGDFREAAHSPTIDAGITSAANGTFDFLGKPRVINGRTDIGADEFDPFTGVVLKKGKVKVKKRKAKVSIGCPAGIPTSCGGTLTLTFGKKTAGTAGFSIPAGTTRGLKVKITKKAFRKLNAKGELDTRATAAATDGAGVSATTSAKLKLSL